MTSGSITRGTFMEAWPTSVLIALAGFAGGVILGLAARLGRFCTLSAIEDAIFSAMTFDACACGRWRSRSPSPVLVCSRRTLASWTSNHRSTTGFRFNPVGMDRRAASCSALAWRFAAPAVTALWRASAAATCARCSVFSSWAFRPTWAIAGPTAHFRNFALVALCDPLALSTTRRRLTAFWA